MNKLLFGTAGVPLGSPDSTLLGGISYLSDLGLDGMELEFVRSVFVREEKASIVKKAAEGKLLTCHGQYYINLNSNESEKVIASKERILNAAKIANLCGCWSLTFHAGFYMKKEADVVYKKIRAELMDVVESLQQHDNKIWVRPETTGKATQFGTLNEILKLSQEVDQVMPCIDFSHLHARDGKNNTYEEFCKNFTDVENVLGKEGLKNLHAHVSGIEYGDKGERKHLVLDESDFNYKDLLKSMKEFGVCGMVISESPNLEEDAIKMKEYFNSI